MAELALFDEDKVAVFSCPECRKPYRKDLSRLPGVGLGSIVNCRCGCGHGFSIQLERRRHRRKPTTLRGAYLHERHQFRGGLTVKNLSRSGAGIEIHTDRQIYEGDVMVLKFNLDDGEETFVAKEGVIRKKEGNYLGVEFLAQTWDTDPLYRYLENSTAASS